MVAENVNDWRLLRLGEMVFGFTNANHNLGLMRNNDKTMRTFISLSALVALAFFAACSPSPQSTILGVWTGVDGGTSEFLKDGTATFKSPRGNAVGKWETPSSVTLKLTFAHGGTEVSQNCKLEVIDKDTIKITPDGGASDVLKRVKD